MRFMRFVQRKVRANSLHLNTAYASMAFLLSESRLLMRPAHSSKGWFRSSVRSSFQDAGNLSALVTDYRPIYLLDTGFQGREKNVG